MSPAVAAPASETIQRDGDASRRFGGRSLPPRDDRRRPPKRHCNDWCGRFEQIADRRGPPANPSIEPYHISIAPRWPHPATSRRGGRPTSVTTRSPCRVGSRVKSLPRSAGLPAMSRTPACLVCPAKQAMRRARRRLKPRSDHGRCGSLCDRLWHSCARANYGGDPYRPAGSGQPTTPSAAHMGERC